ncbi:PAS domain-containing sensor histidine kinase [Desulfitobacterium hafniense]|uniref:histidine kinase n=2 Tax=Desulfitobacterium hafniense TaxID=49338 RepID=A0A0W1JDG2_DESHA|nr:PAS domain-containing sensor histidine kinase [Desulfitobacterium hafniense]
MQSIFAKAAAITIGCYSRNGSTVKKKSSFLKRILILMITTIALYSFLITIFFWFTTNDMFRELQTRELKPSAEAIADLVLNYQQGIMSKGDLEEHFNLNKGIWNFVVHVYDVQGSLIIKNEEILTTLFRGKNAEIGLNLNSAFKEYFDSVLSGDSVVANKGPFLIVGQPIAYNNSIVGMVFLCKPQIEIFTALSGLNRSIWISALGVLWLLSFPLYRAARYIAHPLKQMRDVAISMANGNLKEQANEKYGGEIGELAHSLNYLSSRLSETISALELERNRLKQTIDGLAEGIVAIDNEGNFTHINPSIQRIFGKNPGEGRMSLIPSQELWEDFDAVLAQGYTIVRSLQWKQMLLRVTICPLEDETHHIAGVVGLFRDITESERLEQTRREYVANVSHELRTPVSALRALSETLADGMVSDEETKNRYYHHMLHETMRLTRLINDLLTLSRLQSHTEPVHTEAFLINEVTGSVAERYKPLAQKKGLRFDYSPLVHDLKVMSNMDLVEQVLIILLDNAIKYTQSGGRISLGTVFDKDRVKVSVADTGMGIAPEDLPHIFERFYKADKAHSTQGTGLGLAIAFEISQRLGEEIYVESHLNEGSTFTFTLSCSGASAS